MSALAREAIVKIAEGATLGRAAARTLFEEIMRGSVDTPALCELLTALARRGEALDEIVGAAEALRAHVTAVRLPPGVDAIDTCGTGGDGKPTFNVSSAAAIVAAAAGATVAKHGNRSHARPSGSAEGLAALGVDVEAEVATLERCLAECRIAFLYAPQLHPAMKHAAKARQALGFRTIFNLIGPLTNPAAVRRQLMGVSRPEQVALIAEALRLLGSERAMVVHGRCGVCDLTLDGPTLIARLDAGRIETEEVTCSAFGLKPAPLDHVFVRSAAESAALIRSVLAGSPGPARDTVLFNAAAALWVAGAASSLSEGVGVARDAIDRGAARTTLERWIATSHGRAAG